MSLFARLNQIFRLVEAFPAALLDDRLDDIKREPRHQEPNSLIPHGYKIYSQSEEDGMIAEIFRRIGVTNRVFVEFGIGTGLENNTLALLLQGWSGLWIEANQKSVRAILRGLPETTNCGRLKVVNSFITAENIDNLIRTNLHVAQIDLLSVDIDGNDYHVLRAITCVQPRVIVIEYNAKFPPPLRYIMKYTPGFYWQGGDGSGAALKSLEIGLGEMGYSLVGCSLSGANAFFVQEELARGQFLEPYSAEKHYEPPRYYLSKVTRGHAASFAAIENNQELS
jgi:hypothetical protein